MLNMNNAQEATRPKKQVVHAACHSKYGFYCSVTFGAMQESTGAHESWELVTTQIVAEPGLILG